MNIAQARISYTIVEEGIRDPPFAITARTRELQTEDRTEQDSAGWNIMDVVGVIIDSRMSYDAMCLDFGAE